MGRPLIDLVDLSRQADQRIGIEIEKHGKVFARWLQSQLEKLVSDYKLHWPRFVRKLLLCEWRYRRARELCRWKYMSLLEYMRTCINEYPDKYVLMKINDKIEITVFAPIRGKGIDVHEAEYDGTSHVFYFKPDFDSGRLFLKLYNWD